MFITDDDPKLYRIYRDSEHTQKETDAYRCGTLDIESSKHDFKTIRNEYEAEKVQCIK